MAATQRAIVEGPDPGMTVRCASWRSADGLAGALARGREFMVDEPVVVQQGDALLRGQMRSHIAAFARERLDALALRLADDDDRAAPAPAHLLSSRAVSMVLDGAAAAADPVAGVSARGGRVRVQRVDGCIPCDGDQDALLDTNRRMLEGLEASVDPELVDDSRVQGTVVVHPSALVRRSLLRGPAIIGPGARVVDAYVGPYSSIGAGVTIEGAEIEYSIVLPGAELRFLGTRVESSVIGRGARVERGFALPAAMRMTLGDGAEVVLR
jgi:glucose-1-phosphate thymidylyltransferase